MEDGYHHGGEATQGGEDAGLHAAPPLQHALCSVLPISAKVVLVGVQCSDFTASSRKHDVDEAYLVSLCVALSQAFCARVFFETSYLFKV